MGYTHYFTSSANKVPKKTIEDFKKTFMVMKLKDATPIEINVNDDDALFFNGIGDNSHETMCFKFDGSGEWDFCKTNGKPYDTLVVASLMLAEELGIISSWSSDGDDEYGDFDKGRALYESCHVTSDKTLYNHACDIAFSVVSYNDGEHLTAQELRDALLKRIESLDDDEIIEAVGMPFDTYEEEVE